MQKLLPLQAFFLFLFCSVFPASDAPAQVTVLVPSTPGVEEGQNTQKKDAPPEVDMLITMLRPFHNECLSMDMPQLFAYVRHEPGSDEAERANLLGDVEEIRYMEQKAWGANIALEKRGLYQFILETRPFWDGERDRFLQQQAKVVLPVLGVDSGWDRPAGMSFEILPLTRPFGLQAPALFAGQVLFGGKPLANALVRIGRINTEKTSAITRWHEEMQAKSDAGGKFSFVPNMAGWWYCMAQKDGDPLKGPDGEPKAMENGTVFWLYVDGQEQARR